MDRFHLVMDVIDRVPGLGQRAARVHQHMLDKRAEHRAYTREFGEDMPEVRDWVWPAVLTRGPGRQRRLQQPQAAAAGGRTTTVEASHEVDPWAGDADPSVAGAVRRRTRPRADAVGHRVVHGGRRTRRTPRPARRRRASRRIEALAPLAPLHQPRAAGRHPGGAGRVARRARGRLLRHRLPRHPAAGGRHLRPAGGLAPPLGAPPVRVPRAVARVRRSGGPPSCSDGAPATCGS